MRSLILTCGLAVRDWAHERLLSTCAVLTLASVLTPLLVLFGVRYGVVSALQDRLLQDPAILSVTPTGSGAYTQTWLDALRARPDVAFAIPRTRDIAATIQLVYENPTAQTPDTRFVRASLEPTSAGDPLLARAHLALSPTPNSVILSATAARKLGLSLPLASETTIQGQLGRRRPDGKLESVTLPLRVQAVLPLETEDRDVAFVALSLLEDAELYRDYIAVPARGFAGASPPQGERKYAGFRLYARHLSDVETVRDLLTAQGVEVVTRAREIHTVRSLDRALTLIFLLIALTAAAGFVASTASGVLAAVRRKDKQLGMLRLIGLSGRAIMLYPIVQALLTGLLGTLLAGIVYLGVSYSIDTLFTEQLQGAAVCRMPVLHFLLALGIVLVLSALASLHPACRAAQIQPSEVLREL
ncbi:MAG: FtsX-like permease family protein [Bilophila sp.]